MVSKSKITRPYLNGKEVLEKLRFHGAFTLNGGALTIVDKNLISAIWDE
jgi:hypothetical protein